MSSAGTPPDPEAPPFDEKAVADLAPPSPSPSSLTSHSPPDNPLSLHPSTTIPPSLPREILLVTTIAVAQFTAQASLGNTLAILPILSSHFSLPASRTPWLIAGYSLTFGTFILPSGRLGDIFGHKRLFICGFLWFALWSLVTGLSVYADDGGVLFIFARVMQGIGPAVTVPNGLAILGLVYWGRGRRKDMVFAIFGGVAPGGAVLGGLFASLFSLAWWPWTYFALAILLVGIAVVAVYAIPDLEQNSGFSQDHGTPEGLTETLVSLDLPGAATGITALVLINFAWNQAPIVGWAEAYVIVSLLLGLSLVAVFFLVEVRLAKKPLIPFQALSGDVSFVLGCVACGWGAFGVWIFYSWRFLEDFKGYNPLLASVANIPFVIVGAIAAVCTGFLLSRIRAAWIMAVSMVCFCIGPILTATAPVHQTYWAQIFVCTIVMPFGMDMSFPAATVIMSNAVEKRHQGIAASLVNTVVNYSISLSLGFAGTIETHVSHADTADSALHRLRSALYLSVGLAGLGIILSLLFVGKGYRMDRKSGEL